ncbi:MAG: SDR family oxidoreductase [Candidatus Rokubacteria bacterium]|nr:SDR family oxidoreductase [Candidatus Rokubacteria bacterium]MBI3827388.1 SDR family oxidoreductase [Candidatus Rokubacteria bacterium]
MDLELRGKSALVTGGSRGIGRAVAMGLAKEGARVAICSRSAQSLAATAADIRAKTGVEVLQIPADLSSLAGVTTVATRAVEHFGGLDVLVNNAGAIRGGDFMKIPDEQWMGDWSLKLLGYIRMCRAIFPVMQQHGGGRICNVVGAAARNPSPGYLVGGTANAALINFTKGLADLGAPSQILVTGVSPAATATERWESLIEQQAKAAGQPYEDYRADAVRAYPLGRIGTSEDVADLVCFLVSARAAFLTGITITIDGGSTRGVYP